MLDVDMNELQTGAYRQLDMTAAASVSSEVVSTDFLTRMVNAPLAMQYDIDMATADNLR